MRRLAALGLLLLAATLSQGAMWIGCSVERDADREPQISIQQVRDNLYVFDGGGGNTAALLTARGVVLVDTKYNASGAALLRAIQTVTANPITTIINTHSHADHVGGNRTFATAVEIVAHANTDAALRLAGARVDPIGAGRLLPTRTFTDTLTLQVDGERIDLAYFGAGHTDGDAVVVFPSARVAHVGDLFAGKGPPVIDNARGGSGVAFPGTLAAAYAGLSGVDTLITGHDTLATRDDLRVYAEFNRDFLAWADGQISAASSPEQASFAYQVPEMFKRQGYSARRLDVRTNVERIAEERMRQAPASIAIRAGVRAEPRR